LVRETAGMIAGCEFHEIRQAGHIPCVEQPAVLGRLISAFVARLA
ncbi:MAG: 3-oxoadipate enol-lactonase, partial [Pseudomonadota bacterium]